MRKTLRNIILPSIIAGSLLLSGCPKVDTKEASEEITGEENAYDKALDIARNPGKYATGRVIEKDAVKRDSIIEKVVVEEKGIEWYFLQGKELEGIKLAPMEIMKEEEGVENNPYIASVREIAKFREGWGLEDLTGMGTSLYMPLKKRDLDEPGLSLYILQFESEINAWEGLLQFAERNTLSFLKENTLSFIKINDDIDINEEKIYLYSLTNYQKRIGGIVYPWKVKDTEDHYKKLEMPPSKSGRYFREALEFQKKIYNMGIEEITDFFHDWLDLTPIKKEYQKGTISKKELITELCKRGKELERKIFFSLPRLNERIHNAYRSWDLRIIDYAIYFGIDDALESFDINKWISETLKE